MRSAVAARPKETTLAAVRRRWNRFHGRSYAVRRSGHVMGGGGRQVEAIEGIVERDAPPHRHTENADEIGAGRAGEEPASPSVAEPQLQDRGSAERKRYPHERDDEGRVDDRPVDVLHRLDVGVVTDPGRAGDDRDGPSVEEPGHQARSDDAGDEEQVVRVHPLVLHAVAAAVRSHEPAAAASLA